MNNVSFGILIGQKRRADAAAAAGVAIAERLGQVRQQHRAATRTISELQKENDLLRARVADLELKLVLEEATAAASQAVVDAFKARHPDSPLLAQVGVLKDGSPLRRSTSIWIQAFDVAARKRNVGNPEIYRIG